ncbi:hypothetical protein L1987_43332 [Smallanthus sonchifolius]|uniref:Uncharacterized protein n=1 Tax=Smallanthus sonchifolius TaxID=185202 RepID=A0ACB9GLB7_9ASTR|nr:hypothetical protein L1987_43332 [Smallanthus sonchifolius]
MKSIMQTMMQQLMSKQFLHEPMKEIEEKYPKWLQDSEFKLNKIEYIRYLRQHQITKDLNTIYETEPDIFNKISDLMQKMQECGQPPNDIVKELASAFDTTLGHL